VLDPAGRRPFTLFDAAGTWMGGSPATLAQPQPPMDRRLGYQHRRRAVNASRR